MQTKRMPNSLLASTVAPLTYTNFHCVHMINGCTHNHSDDCLLLDTIYYVYTQQNCEEWHSRGALLTKPYEFV